MKHTTGTLLFSLSLGLATIGLTITNVHAEETFSLEMAHTCIQLNNDLGLASQQMLSTEAAKAELASKIRYLDGVIAERRRLIEKLDQVATQQNNENYNQLITQYEDLTEERRLAISEYNTSHELHISQHNSVVRLEQRFNSQCLQNIILTEDVYREACKDQQVRWCSAFSFN